MSMTNSPHLVLQYTLASLTLGRSTPELVAAHPQLYWHVSEVLS